MPQPSHEKANPLGTVALVVAVLGVVSLFQEGKRKDLGIAAIVVSVVAGTIVPFVLVGLPF